MNKALVEVYVPAAEKTFDVFIPYESLLNDVLKLLSKMLCDLSDGKCLEFKDAVLCDKKTGAVLDINMTVFELGIKNGSSLMLI